MKLNDIVLPDYGEMLHDYIIENLQGREKAEYLLAFQQYFKVYEYGLVGERAVLIINDITDECVAFMERYRDIMERDNLCEYSRTRMSDTVEYLRVLREQNCTIKDTSQTEKSADKLEPQQILLPHELDTERARLCFAKAFEAGFMERTETGYKWLFQNGSKATLAYFTEKVFCPQITDTYPEVLINKLFGVSRIGKARTQVYDARKPQVWRNQIDRLFN